MRATYLNAVPGGDYVDVIAAVAQKMKDPVDATGIVFPLGHCAPPQSNTSQVPSAKVLDAICLALTEAGIVYMPIIVRLSSLSSVPSY